MELLYYGCNNEYVEEVSVSSILAKSGLSLLSTSILLGFSLDPFFLASVSILIAVFPIKAGLIVSKAILVES
jgi:hypothetical protein